MKVFEFPLQVALKLRRHRQDLAHRRFAVLQSQYNSAHDQLRHYKRLLSLAGRLLSLPVRLMWM
jgi:hypothetical protein